MAKRPFPKFPPTVLGLTDAVPPPPGQQVPEPGEDVPFSVGRTISAVVVEFAKPIHWMTLDTAQAETFAKIILENVAAIRKGAQ